MRRSFKNSEFWELQKIPSFHHLKFCDLVTDGVYKALMLLLFVDSDLFISCGLSLSVVKYSVLTQCYVLFPRRATVRNDDKHRVLQGWP